MNMQEIYGLIDRMEQSNLASIKIEHDGTLLEMSHGTTAVAATAVAHAMPAEVLPTQAQMPVVGSNVCAPLAGTFYAAASSDSAPFVQVGDRVTKGQPLCILEAMKSMNELPSPFDGTVAEILVQNGDIIGYDQVLFRIME